MPLTAERLRSLLHYDPETGEWRWRITYSGKAKAGQLAGHIEVSGYRRIAIAGRRYFSARLAWLYMTGEWPPAEMDHIDLDQANDRWSNLRQATIAQNKANRRMMGNSTSLLKGAQPNRDKWRARIRIDGKRINLGTFDTMEQAHAAYMTALRKQHGAFARSD